jgi:hypothetical protein
MSTPAAGVVIDGLLRTLEEETQGEDSSVARAWLQDLRTPLVMAGVDTIVSLTQATAAGKTDEELEKAMAQLTPAQLVEVARANATALARLEDQVVRQAGLWKLTKEKLTSGAASLLVRGLILVL